MAEPSETYDLERADGALLNELTGQGVAGFDKSISTKLVGTPLLSQAEVERLLPLWIPNRICSFIADICVQKGWTITTGDDADPDAVKAIAQEYRRLKVAKHFADAITWQRAAGGAAIVLIVDDGSDQNDATYAERPLNLDRLRSIQRLVVLDRYQIQPYPTADDIWDLSDPTYYQLSAAKTQEYGLASSSKIHCSRVLRFDGLRLMDNQRQNNEGWGMSCLQPVFDAWKRYQTGLDSAAAVLVDFDIFWHAISGLDRMLDAGNRGKLQERLAINRLGRSIHKTMVLNKDREEIGFLTRSGVQGISTILEQFTKDLQGATGLPHTVLFNESPSGLGASGDSEKEDLASYVRGWQASYIYDPLWYLTQLIQRASDGPTGGQELDDWDIQFNPIFESRPKEIAETRKITAETDKLYYDMGAIAAEELRASRFGGSSYNMETQLSKDEMPEEPEEPETPEPPEEQESPEANTAQNADAEPIRITGYVLSERDFDQIAEIDKDDIREAVEDWRENAPAQFRNILEATEDA